MGPLLAAWIIIPGGQHSILWFSLLAMLAIMILVKVEGWYKHRRFHLPMQQAQYHLFAFLFAIALGTVIGRPIGDRIGRLEC